MFDPAEKPRVFALPPGAAFPEDLVQGLTDRFGDMPPEAMARVTLYLNTGRMLRAVRAAFDGRGARLLPRLRLVSDLALDPVPGLPLPVAPLARRLDLMRLVEAMLRQGGGRAQGRAAFGLADSLARLLEEMQGEGVPPDVFDAADFAADHARHWDRSLAFLRIAAGYLSADCRPDPEGRRRRVVDRLAELWRTAPPRDPVLIAGSTGSRGTTLSLMRAVAALPTGAVILPGFDFDMPSAAWNSLDSGPILSEDHPQYRFRALLGALGLQPSDVIPWRQDRAPDPRRNRVLSLALHPAPVTDRWLVDGPTLGSLPDAMARVTLLEAASAREEATATALILRHAVSEGRRAALITPDRVLARRVTAALDRWGLVPDDSAGRPLNQSATGRFLRQTAALGLRPPSAEALMALLKHPLTASGGGRGQHLLFTRDLELALRRGKVVLHVPGALRQWAKGQGDPGRIAWADWVGWLAGYPLRRGAAPLSAVLEAHVHLSERIAAGPGGAGGAGRLWAEDAGAAALQRINALREAARDAPEIRGEDYLDLLDSLLAEETVRATEAAHPLVAILGTLEARVQGAEITVLAGLNEGVWPGAPEPDPWLSRQMRQRAGLLSPERQIGLSAHDFQQAAAAPKVVLSRALRDDESETVASRWLSRLSSLLNGLPAQAGPEAWAAMQARGDRWLRLARAAEAPEARHRAPPARRPAPRPPVAARPRTLPVTDIATLIRDPYAIYAKRILRLRALDPLARRPDGRLLGTVMHRVLDRFIRERQLPEDAATALRRLGIAADDVLEAMVPWPGIRQAYRGRLDRIAEAFLADERRRAALGVPVILEEPGEMGLQSVDFLLTARPDRIDLLHDGSAHVYDYKTGTPPSVPQQQHFDKQLRLEAVMVMQGAFASLGAVQAVAASHIALGSGAGERSARITPEVLTETWEGLHRLIAAYHRRSTGYTSRRAVFQAKIEGDYDHLARAGEWEMSDPPAPEDVA